MLLVVDGSNGVSGQALYTGEYSKPNILSHW